MVRGIWIPAFAGMTGVGRGSAIPDALQPADQVIERAVPCLYTERKAEQRPYHQQADGDRAIMLAAQEFALDQVTL